MVVLDSPDNSISKWHGVFALNPLFTDGERLLYKTCTKSVFVHTSRTHKFTASRQPVVLT